MSGSSGLRVALATHATRPRGGVVHTLALAEVLAELGVEVQVIAIGDPAAGFFRPVAVPVTLVPPPVGPTTLTEKVFASVDALADAFRGQAATFDLVHTQDCISARAAARVRDEGLGPAVLRTVHHVDAFTTPALIDCQRQAILEPDRVLVVSDTWRRRLRAEYGVEATVVPNGLATDRFPPVTAARRAALRATVGGERRPVVLSVGGIEPRKGSTVLFSALGLLADQELRPVLVIAGGHSFQDYAPYREQALAMLDGLGLVSGVDVVQVGTLTEDELGAWFHSADVFAFPSLEEGFGLVVLEALGAGLPVVASSLEVFGEYLTDGETALLPQAGDPVALAAALRQVLTDPGLRRRLSAQGADVPARFTWQGSAQRHLQIYSEITDQSA